MVETRGDLDLAQEALGTERRSELRPQHLDRDVAVVLDVVGEIHGGHPAPAKLPLDGVAALEGFVERGEIVTHGG